MADKDLALARLVSQGLHHTRGLPHEIVSSFLAMQGQDFSGALSSIALRAGTDALAVEKAFETGQLVRAYPMRGTVFVIAAEDARWLSELCNAGAVRAQEKRRGFLGLEEHHFTAARDVLESTVGVSGVPRAILFDAWRERGVDPAGGRGYHMLSYFIATGIAVYGPVEHSENRVCAAHSWLPEKSSLSAKYGDDRVAAAAELLSRYFRTRGPATIRDASWWSKLPLALLRDAAEQLDDDIERIEGEEPVFQRATLVDELAAADKNLAVPRLIPGFDELLLGYPDRGYVVPEAHLDKIVPGGNGVFKPTAMASGQVLGTWKRTGRPGKRSFELNPFTSVSVTRQRAFERAFRVFPFAGL